ncbi:MAG TPA: TolC family protein [Abditibacteriaceae bacterium]|nr:TolC family protein [Abditibacteriaceae bacterium]
MSRLLQISPLLGFCLFFAVSVAAQENPPPVPVIAPEVSTEPEIALDELIRRAIQNNPQLPIARENLEAARQRLGASRALGNPVLQIVPGIGNREARDEEIILSQPLDLFGHRRARAGVAGAEVRRAQAESTLAERSLVVAVKNAAADLFAAQEAEALGQVQVEVAQLFRDAAARRAELGDVPPVQMQRAELELWRVQNELTTAQAERLARRAGLNQLVGQAPETPLRVALPISTGLTDVLRVRPGPLRPGATGVPATGAPGDIPATTPAEVEPQIPAPGPVPIAPQTPLIDGSSQVGSDLVGLRAQLLPGALQRPDIVGAQATLEARRAQVQVLRRERLPEIELQARRSSVTGSGSTALRAVVVVPIFDFGSNKGERRALEAEARAQEAQIALLRQQAAAQVEQALLRLGQQRQTVERYRTGIVPQTLDLLRKTQIGYAQGASTYLEVLEAQRTLRQVQTEYLQALVGTRTIEAQLEGALGANLPASLTGVLTNPTGASTPPGVAAPGTVPEGTIPPNTVAPLNPPDARPLADGNEGGGN